MLKREREKKRGTKDTRRRVKLVDRKQTDNAKTKNLYSAWLIVVNLNIIWPLAVISLIGNHTTSANLIFEYINGFKNNGEDRLTCNRIAFENRSLARLSFKMLKKNNKRLYGIKRQPCTFFLGIIQNGEKCRPFLYKFYYLSYIN